MIEERYDHPRHCRIPANLLPSDIIKLSKYFDLEPLEFIALHCNIISVHEHAQRLKKLGISIPEIPEDMEMYYIQLKASRYCKFFTGRKCQIPLTVRPRQCTKMSLNEKLRYELEKQSFYLEMVKLIDQVGTPIKALEIYLTNLGLI